MTRKNWWAWFLSVSAMVLMTAPLAVLFGYKWLAFDEPNRRYACKGGSTCWSGETVNVMLASVFGAFAVIFAGITIVVLHRWRRWRNKQQVQPKEVSVEL